VNTKRNTEAKVEVLVQDIATFTHAKPRGKDHKSPVLPAHQASMRGTLAGQDYALVLHPVPGDMRQTMVLNCDGHGDQGELFAVAGGEYLSRYFEQAWEELRSCCQRGDRDRVQEMARDIFAKCDGAMLRELGERFVGGTTATVCCLIDGIHIITANVGDSPAMLAFEDGREHVMLTEPHSADSPEEYTRYCARCHGDGLEPAQFVYNRFNCGGGHKMPGPDGSWSPIPIFELDEKGEARVIQANSEYIGTLGYHGGIQSVRKHVVIDEEGKAIGTQADKCYQNWGSTVAGRPQNTRILGDFEDKKALHLDCEPSTSMRTLDRSTGTVWLMVASDGIADAHWFENVSDSLVRRARRGIKNAQGLCESLVVDTITNAKAAQFTFEDNLPAWDDLSLTLVALPAYEQPGQHSSEDGEPDMMARVDSNYSDRSERIGESSPYQSPSPPREGCMMDVEPVSREGHGPIRKNRQPKKDEAVFQQHAHAVDVAC